MGSGSSKTHETFAVAPASGAQAAVEDQPQLDEPVLGAAELDKALEALAAADLHAGSVADQYAALSAAVEQAHAWSALASAAGAGPDQLAEVDDAVKGATGSYLSGLSPSELQELAHAHGFTHPHLVGLSPSAGTHPLLHYLDPAYPDGIPSKAAIAAKADERYAQLAAGGSIAGFSFADVQTLEAQLGAGSSPPLAGFTTWTATPLQVLQASTAVSQAAAAVTAAGGPATPEQLAALLAAENRLHTATCPTAPDALTQAQAAATAHVDAALKTTGYGYSAGTPLRQMLDNAHTADRLTDAEHFLLVTGDQVALLRASTTPAVRDALQDTCQAREAKLAAFLDARAAYSTLHPAFLDGSGDVAGFATAAGVLHTARSELISDCPSTKQTHDYIQQLTGAPLMHEGSVSDLTGTFKAWQKQQPLPSLRAAAATLGLQHPEKAPRGDVVKFIAGQWGAYDQAAVQGSVTAKHQLAAAAAASTPAPHGAEPGAAAKSGAAPNPTAPGRQVPAGWAGKQAALVAALRHHAATAAVTPAPHDPAVVASWTFTPAGSATHLGGTHSKSLVAAPDGSTWLFKPDTTTGGARSHAESAASAVYTAAGLPAVGVHVADIGGKTGSVQPLLAGTSPLAADPAAWTQADVDAIVRHHVAAWAVGDHDAHHGNMLRTSGGGLLPCDHGAAFKHYGRDKLHLDYTPHAGHSFPPPVFHVAYRAAAAGKLAPGVTIRPEAALPTLKSFEAIPEGRYRGLLHTVAHAGAARGVNWAHPLRATAATARGCSPASITTEQLAEHFLDHAVNRKNNLRSGFAGFFAALGYTAGAEKVSQL